MIELIQEILKDLSGVSAWKINEKTVNSEELFFVRKKLDMNRSKVVHHYFVTVYVDFEEEGKAYRGSSKAGIAPTMSLDEVKEILEDATFAASLVKNEPYSIVQPSNECPQYCQSNFSMEPLAKWMPLLIKAIYEADVEESCLINSTEIFLNLISHRILNSEGVDLQFEQYMGEIELITECNEGEEGIELFSLFDFSEYHPHLLQEKVREMLLESRERAFAGEAPSLKGIPVILTGDAVKEFFMYYVSNSSAQAIYEGVSSFKIGEELQGSAVDGDLLHIQLIPNMSNSSESMPYDEDGQLLKTLTLIEEGQLKSYHGSKQYTDYLKQTTTGSIHNVKVGVGTHSVAEFKQQPYVELLSFSDFQMNEMTGNFGGEVRLGRYFDGQTIKPITRGSISANLKDIQHGLLFSKEEIQLNNYIGPKFIKLPPLDIAGN